MDFDELPELTPSKPVSRNAPCPCGSGKKYKRCCLPKEVRQDLAAIDRDLEEGMIRPDRFDDPQLDAWKQADRSVIQKLIKAVNQAHPKVQVLLDKYFPRSLGENLARLSMHSQALGDLYDWAGVDYRPEPGAKTEAEKLLEHPLGLTEKERRVLAGMAGSARSAWQVVRIEKDKGVEVEDLLRGGRVFITDVSLSRSAALWTIAVFRAYPAGPYHFISGGWACLPPSHKGMVVTFFKRYFKTYRRKHPEATWDEFLRARPELFPRMVDESGAYDERPAPKLTNMDGEPLIFCQAEFSAEDANAALAALDGKERFEVWERDGQRGASCYGAKPRPGLMGKPVDAVVKVSGGKLALECNSRKRLERAKKVLLSLPGVRHLKDNIRTMEDMMAERPFRSRLDSGEPQPKELADLQRSFQEQYYEHDWVRDHIPALGGKTPLEMVKTAQGRQQVEALIKHMEFLGTARESPEKRYDFNRLRRVLGLPET